MSHHCRSWVNVGSAYSFGFFGFFFYYFLKVIIKFTDAIKMNEAIPLLFVKRHSFSEFTFILFCRKYELSMNLKVFAKFPKTTREQCEEELLVVPSGADTLAYCSQTTKLLYRNDTRPFRIPPRTEKILTFTYSKNSAEGGKYILQVEGLCVSIHWFLKFF